MDLSADKKMLIRLLEETEDQSLIDRIKALFESRKDDVDIFEDMPDEIKGSFERGLKQADAGQGTPHREVMKKYSKWLKR